MQLKHVTKHGSLIFSPPWPCPPQRTTRIPSATPPVTCTFHSPSTARACECNVCDAFSFTCDACTGCISRCRCTGADIATSPFNLPPSTHQRQQRSTYSSPHLGGAFHPPPSGPPEPALRVLWPTACSLHSRAGFRSGWPSLRGHCVFAPSGAMRRPRVDILRRALTVPS